MIKYGVIIADPPWKYSNSGVRANVEDQYKSTMVTSEICDLQIGRLAAKDALLLLWCTWPFMVEGLEVCNSWGFKYKTGFPYIKTVGFPRTDLFTGCQMKLQQGVGFWTLGCTEIVMICTRGNMKPPPPGKRPAGLISPNFGHSRKPDSLHDYAEIFDGPYLELFARRTRPGWDAWGNEVESSIKIAT